MSESSSNPAPGSFSSLVAGCGYVGGRVAQRWAKGGAAVHVVTRSADKAQRLRTDGLQPLVLNLGSQDSWPSLPDVDTVLWAVGFDRSPGASREATWIDGLRRLLTALPVRSKPRRIVYTSSTGVYGDGDGATMDERTTAVPKSEGGQACLAAEMILQEYAALTGSEVVILRLAGIYGPDRLLRRVTELQNQTPIPSPPDEWLNLIHVDDAVRVVDWCATHGTWDTIPSEPGLTKNPQTKLINVVSAHSVTRRSYYSLLAKLVSAPEPVFATSSEAAEPGSFRRQRGGNRRVVSRYRADLPVRFEFDDCEAGLLNAVQNSTS